MIDDSTMTAVGDINQDGIPDLAVTEPGSHYPDGGNVHVLLLDQHGVCRRILVQGPYTQSLRGCSVLVLPGICDRLFRVKLRWDLLFRAASGCRSAGLRLPASGIPQHCRSRR